MLSNKEVGLMGAGTGLYKSHTM